MGSPRLKTILMIENTLKNMEDSAITLANLKKILPKKVNHYTLMEALHYLYDSKKIIYCPDGILWIYNDSPKLQKAIEEGYEWKPDKKD
ncbi:MAG: hypothetical protein ISS25_04565 [Nanoarchaeota archaeon]|nr:hypothetical protein [DPANN group archaeon]MBL7117073.1 hypothetical protein [Nanoarchaeota archaeon]